MPSTQSASRKYQRIADTLRARILDGRYRIGERIPTAAQLEQDFAVSNITIRKALDQLAGEGLVAGRRGGGTVVLERPPGSTVDIRISGGFADWLNTASARGIDFEQVMHGVDRVACPPRLAALPGFQDSPEVFCLRRTRNVDATPISYHVSYGRSDLADTIGIDSLPRNGNFVDQLRAHYPAKIVKLEQHVEARSADLDISRLLHIEFGTPLFFVENQYIDARDQVAAVTHLWLRGDRYRYHASIDIENNS